MKKFIMMALLFALSSMAVMAQETAPTWAPTEFSLDTIGTSVLPVYWTVLKVMGIVMCGGIALAIMRMAYRRVCALLK